MSKARGKTINGQGVIIDGSYPHRWVDAFGPDVVKAVKNFDAQPFASADNMADCTTTLVETGAGETTVALKGGATGGALLITTDNFNNDGANIQVQGEAFKLASGKPAYFGIKLQATEAVDSDFFAGFSITDTDILGGVTDAIGFKKVDASAKVYFEMVKDSCTMDMEVGTLTAATDMILEFYFDGSNVDSYVDGVLQTRLAVDALPDDEYLTPSVQFLTGSDDAAAMTIDWLRAFQITA